MADGLVAEELPLRLETEEHKLPQRALRHTRQLPSRTVSLICELLQTGAACTRAWTRARLDLEAVRCSLVSVRVVYIDSTYLGPAHVRFGMSSPRTILPC